MHVFPLQHPVAHEVASHRQRPFAHRWPGPHGAPAPHRQSPAVEQLSALAGGQARHAPPSAPQVPSARALQTPFEQHPSGQDAAEHPQPLPTHAWPTGHCGSVPQRHAPEAEHMLARVASHAEQLAPAEPHAPLVVGLTHWLLVQQPVGHEVESHLHAPPTHR